MKIGVVFGESDIFWRPVAEQLASTHQCTEFDEDIRRLPILGHRMNQRLLKLALSRFMAAQDVTFFDWATHLLAIATHMRPVGPLVARLHSFELYDWGPRIDWSRVDQVIVVSRAMRRRFLEAHPGNDDRVRVVNYGKNLDLYRPTGRPAGTVLGMLGGLLPVKRTYEVVLAVREAVDAGADVTLRLGGEPGRGANNIRYFLSLQRMIKELGLTERVQLDGPITDVPKWLGGIDVFISHSFWEGQQNALIEAMACGCIGWAHRWDGAEEVLPDEYLYWTPSDLVARMVGLGHMPPDEFDRQRAQMRCIVEERFDGRRECCQIEATFHDALAAPNRVAGLA